MTKEEFKKSYIANNDNGCEPEELDDEVDFLWNLRQSEIAALEAKIERMKNIQNCKHKTIVCCLGLTGDDNYCPCKKWEMK